MKSLRNLALKVNRLFLFCNNIILMLQKAVNTVDDAGYTVVKNQLGGKSSGADTKAAATPANPSKHEKNGC